MTKNAILFSLAIFCLNFVSIKNSYALPEEKCGSDHVLCQAVQICQYYRMSYTPESSFESVVRKTSYEIVKLNCEWEFGLVIAGTIITPN